MVRVLISRFKHSNEGELTELGIAELEIRAIPLGTRLKSQSCVTPTVDFSIKTVDCVLIGHEYYVVGLPATWNKRKADYEVNLSHENTIVWHCEPITEVRIKETK